MSKASEVVV